MKASPGSRFIHALQVGGLLALGMFLWGVSLFPIQRAVLVCECSVLVSPREHVKLAEIGRQSSIASSSIDWLACEPISVHSESVSTGRAEGEVAVRRVRLRLGMGRRATLAELERELTGLTAYGTESVQPPSEVHRGICHARWRLQVAEHALARFRLDCARDGIELRDDPTESDPTESSPFRLASRSSSTAVSDAKLVFESLRSDVDAARGGLDLAIGEISKREREARGVFTMSGTPRYIMRGGPLDRVRVSILFLSACGILGLVAMRWKGNRSRKRTEQTPCTRQDMLKMLDGLRLPYLGVLPLEADDTAPEIPVRVVRSQSGRFRLQRLYRLSMWSRWSDRILAFWIACFLLRYVLDPTWRELLFRAPLAAFSSVLFGF